MNANDWFQSKAIEYQLSGPAQFVKDNKLLAAGVALMVLLVLSLVF